jgi:hypothetical protein
VASLETGETAYQKGDYSTALQIFRPLAEQGNAFAQADLGLMYAQGQGVAQDDAQALVWLNKAADKGFAPAQFSLGWMYRNGHGVAQAAGPRVVAQSRRSGVPRRAGQPRSDVRPGPRRGAGLRTGPKKAPASTGGRSMPCWKDIST